MVSDGQPSLGPLPCLLLRFHPSVSLAAAVAASHVLTHRWERQWSLGTVLRIVLTLRGPLDSAEQAVRAVDWMSSEWLECSAWPLSGFWNFACCHYYPFPTNLTERNMGKWRCQPLKIHHFLSQGLFKVLIICLVLRSEWGMRAIFLPLWETGKAWLNGEKPRGSARQMSAWVGSASQTGGPSESPSPLPGLKGPPQPLTSMSLPHLPFLLCGTQGSGFSPPCFL